MSPKRNAIFVYGTLLRGESNHRFLQHATFLGDAETPAAFDLLDLGAYPAMIAGGKTAVVGEIYRVDDHTLSGLDRLEGHPHLFARTEIFLSDGMQVQAYLLVDARGWEAQRIPSGSWRARTLEPGDRELSEGEGEHRDNRGARGSYR